MGAHFWWFYDVIAVAVVLVCAFITIKKGFMKAIISIVGYILSVVIAVSISNAVTGNVYSKIVRESNIKKLNNALSSVDILGEVANHINTLGYNIFVDASEIEKIVKSGKDIDTGIYKYANNINNKKVDEEGIFINKLHEGYAVITSRVISRELNEFAAESAAEYVRGDPESFHELMKLLDDPENKAPVSRYIADNYIAQPYMTMIKMIVMFIFLLIAILITILVSRSAGKHDVMEPGIVRHTLCGVIGIFKGAIIIFAIAVMVRLYVLLGSNKMLFFNNEAIENSYIFKYIYDILLDM